ncbi:DUF6582 domain-containing protein [Actinoplanes teichomyceticus]|uniref:Rho termination factor-like protein n=1 Tax=Actinoplanes teichomyceticus TaxID=1867 RepID=A0A561VLN0_ACTTI|nr:DUF6582 domain-containing protein [Actinoplanes teichomyceticus]TWG12521.1 hypothetical protein FHX34_105388 [Actinoplanes teichomyceticus]GIF13885.1 hypothetical protein Ate01nite_39170 [Actinoplanes teichomyceticus]
MAAKKTTALDAAARDAMPDSEFAFPRLRKEPLHDASHVRNAIARFDQVRDATDAERDEAFRRIQRAARRLGVQMTETSWRELGKPTKRMKSSSKPRDPGVARSGRTKAELYAEARDRGVAGRSTMTKAELVRALQKR